MTNEQLITGALAWANQIREYSGREPLTELPKGVREDAYKCPLACALGFGAEVDAAFANLLDSEDFDDIHELPEDVSLFVREFDRGEIRELIAA